ncbi:MAG: hypothetical protein ABJO88_11795 [Parasphingorhabdus sp.]
MNDENMLAGDVKATIETTKSEGHTIHLIDRSKGIFFNCLISRSMERKALISVNLNVPTSLLRLIFLIPSYWAIDCPAKLGYANCHG